MNTQCSIWLPGNTSRHIWVSDVPSLNLYKPHQYLLAHSRTMDSTEQGPCFPTHSIWSIAWPGYTGQRLQFAWLTLDILHRRQFFKLMSCVYFGLSCQQQHFQLQWQEEWSPSRVSPNSRLSFPKQVGAITSWCFFSLSSRILFFFFKNCAFVLWYGMM